MSKSSLFALSLSLDRLFKASTTAVCLGAIALTPVPALAQALGGYGQRPNSTAAAPRSQAMPSWAGPQMTPTWAGPQMTPTWAGPQQTPSWAQPPSPNYRRQSPVFSPAPVTAAPIFNKSSSPPSLSTETPASTRQSSSPGRDYKRRVVMPSVGNGLGYPYGGSGSVRSTAPVISHTNSNVVAGSTPVAVGPTASFRVTTPVGERVLPARDYSNYVYKSAITYVGGPTLLGGYYYGNYCNVQYDQYCYPSVYGSYFGMPQFIYNPGVIILSAPEIPVYATSYIPFTTPVYQVTYNENNYYVASEDRAQEMSQSGAPAQEAIKSAYLADSYQAAFADIQNAWLKNDPALIDRHLRDKDTKMSVFVDGKYTYSLASSDFLQITRDAFDRLNTTTFNFTRLRKAKNGDVTAFGKHVYRSSGNADTSTNAAALGDTVPFSTDGTQPTDKASAPALGEEKTIYVSYTLRQHDKDWYIIAVDSSATDLVK